eukprot:18474-Heterococcus_DN1.PRE.1
MTLAAPASAAAALMQQHSAVTVSAAMTAVLLQQRRHMPQLVALLAATRHQLAAAVQSAVVAMCSSSSNSSSLTCTRLSSPVLTSRSVLLSCAGGVQQCTTAVWLVRRCASRTLHIQHSVKLSCALIWVIRLSVRPTRTVKIVNSRQSPFFLTLTRGNRLRGVLIAFCRNSCCCVMVRAKLTGPCAQVLSDMRHDIRALQQHLSDQGFTNPEQIRKHTTTLLHAACIDDALRKPESVVKQLVEAGADPNIRAGTSVAALMLTTSAEIASCLLDNGADVNKQTEQGLTVLHFAASGHLALAKLLLERGAQGQILKRGKSGETPFSTAVYGGHVEVALLLLEQLLLRPGFDINYPRLGANQPLLCAAAKVGMLQVIDVALNHGAHVNATGPDGPALLLAVKGGHLDVVSLLCERGAAVHMRWGSEDSFKVAVMLGDIPIMKKLMSYGADVNAAYS